MRKRPDKPASTGNPLLDALQEAEKENEREQRREQRQQARTAPREKPAPRPRKPPVSAPKGDVVTQALQEADIQFEADQKRIIRRVKWQWLEQMPERTRKVFKWTLLSLLTVFLLLVGDGMRREGKEAAARLVAVSGAATVTRSGEKAAVAAENEMGVSSGDVLQTGAGGSMTLVFVDGSAIELEPNTRFEVRQMDYRRGGVRSQSFLVRAGLAIARVGKHFGVGSAAQLTTPTAVAAVRGTGFGVFYDGATQASFVGVVDGVVQARTAGGAVNVTVGFGATAVGNAAPRLEPLRPASAARLRVVFGQLAAYERAPNVLERAERGLLRGLDPVFQPVGLVPGGWRISATDSAQRLAAQEGLRKIQQLLAALPDQVPDSVSLVTLEEITTDDQLRQPILNTFGGRTLESYQKTGQTSYIIRARARDRQHTLYELNETGVRRIVEP